MPRNEQKRPGHKPGELCKEPQNKSGHQLDNRSRSTSSNPPVDNINSHSDYEYYEYSEESEDDYQNIVGESYRIPHRENQAYRERDLNINRRSQNIVKESYRAPHQENQTYRECGINTNRRTKNILRESYRAPHQENQTWERDINLNRRSQSLNGGFSCLIIGIIIIIVAVVAVSGYLRNETLTERNYITCTFDKLAKKYPSQKKDTWMNLKITIEGIMNNKEPKPANFLFLCDDKKSIDLVRKIAQKASYCFDPDSEPVEITLNEFTSNEAKKNDSTVIELYKKKMKEGNVAIIANLNEIPPEVSKALHFICDTYSPIVHNKVVNFLTLKPTINKGKLLEIAEKSLSNLWSSFTDAELEPLIIRVTDQVIKIEPF